MSVILEKVELLQIYRKDGHSYGRGGSMRACHAAGPGSIPDHDKFPGWGFFRGFSSPVRQMSGNFRPTKSPNIIWPSLSSFHLRLVGNCFPNPRIRCSYYSILRICSIKNTLLSNKFLPKSRLSCLCCLRGDPDIGLSHSYGVAFHVLVWSKK